MTRATVLLSVVLASGVQAFAGQAQANPTRLWAQAERLLAEEKYAEAEKVCRDLLAEGVAPLYQLRASAALVEVYCNLDKPGPMQEFAAKTEERLKTTQDAQANARLLFFKSVLACKRQDFKGCVALLKKAAAALDEAFVWAAEGKAKYFADILLLDDASQERKDLEALADLKNVDKDLRAQIAAACAEAKKQGKRVLLHFYGDWCPWCRDMDKCLKQPEVAKALEKFICLKIDVGRFDKHKIVMGEYVDTISVPALVVLDADGARIAHLPSASYEDQAKGINDPARVAKGLLSHAP